MIGDAGDDAGLLEIADAVGDDAGRHDDEEVSRDREEAGQVEAHRSGVDRPAQGRPEDEADDDARRGGGRVLLDGGFHGGPDEQGGLHALAADGDDRDPHHAPAGVADTEGVAQGVTDLALELTRVAPHPQDHPGDEADGHQGQDAADDLLGLECQGLGAPGQDGAQSQGQKGGEPHTEPQLGEDIAALGLDEVGGDDADDERGLETLSQCDEEIGQEHGLASTSDEEPANRGLGESNLHINRRTRTRHNPYEALKNARKR